MWETREIKNTTNAEQWKGTYRKVWARRNVRKDRGPPTEKVRGNRDEQRSKGRVTKGISFAFGS